MYNGNFMDTMEKINQIAKANGYVNGIACAREAVDKGLLNQYDYNAFENCHNLRNMIAHGNSIDINISLETMGVAKVFYERISAYIETKQQATPPSYVNKVNEEDLRTLKDGDIIVLWGIEGKDSNNERLLCGEIYLVKSKEVQYSSFDYLYIHRCGGKGVNFGNEETFYDSTFLDKMYEMSESPHATLIRGAKIDIPCNYHYAIKRRRMDDKKSMEIEYITIERKVDFIKISRNESVKKFSGMAFDLFPAFFRPEEPWPLLPMDSELDCTHYWTEDMMNDRFDWYEVLLNKRKYGRR